MTRMKNRLVCGMMAVLLASVMTIGQSAQGDDAALPAAKSNVAKRGLLRRLPHYYGKVVTKEQKEKIYKVQEEYHPKIEALQTQLDALEKERDEKISAVLTPEQQKQVKDAEAAAKAARATKAEKEKDSAKTEK
jgi:hypothetical protein